MITQRCLIRRKRKERDGQSYKRDTNVNSIQENNNPPELFGEQGFSLLFGSGG